MLVVMERLKVKLQFVFNIPKGRTYLDVRLEVDSIYGIWLCSNSVLVCMSLTLRRGKELSPVDVVI